MSLQYRKKTVKPISALTHKHKEQHIHTLI